MRRRKKLCEPKWRLGTDFPYTNKNKITILKIAVLVLILIKEYKVSVPKSK